ncbi:hypothetical protein PPACK8108_LOCUS11548 [Phakopsora pachyrhizi]|uniref:Uncharacterized protein n=1 Tax=Phakopsora pachyrhizi TaxID=170000 RepID=A0AAV0B390_PHAPC|nr:hypothetical protein PPACK8108_LOCUS11548 [Phakopsora pachyrhizi]
MIRHVPLNFYADDTSGNLSKQSGLPPHFSNLELNTFFVGTSNIASALELFTPVNEELNKISTTGFSAFDFSIQEDVLVLPVVLLFMADSPMHAEITSTMSPNISLQPCRISVYVEKFLGRNLNGFLFQTELRSWTATKDNVYYTWEMIQRGAPKTQIQKSITELGVKDVLNQAVIKILKENQDTKLIFKINKFQEEKIQELFNPFFELKGFDGHKDTPVEVLHVVLLGVLKYLYRDLISSLSIGKKDELVARLQSFDTNNLNIPSIKAKYLVQHYSSLLGKDFKILIQTAPFVIFPLIEESRHQIWISLCHLCSVIFQTHISDLPKYLSLLHYFTQDFLLRLISSNAQWINNPKFHIYSTSFESYNGVVRQASIHSNRQSPSHDIANNFQNYSALRFCLSGGNLKAQDLNSNSYQSYQGRSIFIKIPTIQKLLGLDPQIFKAKQNFPCFKLKNQATENNHDEVTLCIKRKSPNSDWHKIQSFELDKHQKIKSKSFISVKPQQPNQNSFIAYIIDIWAVDDISHQKIHLHCQQCQILQIDTFYGMRASKKNSTEEIVSARNVISGFNVQHHCVGAKCLIKRTLARKVEQQQTDMMLEVHHNHDFNLYVINTASLRAQEAHHAPARIPTPEIQALDALNAVHDGLSEWKKNKSNAPESMTSIDPSLQ